MSVIKARLFTQTRMIIPHILSGMFGPLPMMSSKLILVVVHFMIFFTTNSSLVVSLDFLQLCWMLWWCVGCSHASISSCVVSRIVPGSVDSLNFLLVFSVSPSFFSLFSFFEVISCGDQCETVQSVLFDSFLGSLIRGYCEWDFLDFLSCLKLLRYVDVVGTLSDVEWALSNGRDLIR